MTKEELRDFRRKQKLRIADIAWICDVSPRQVYRWWYGDTPIPQPVELVLLALATGKIDARWLIKHIRKPIS